MDRGVRGWLLRGRVPAGNSRFLRESGSLLASDVAVAQALADVATIGILHQRILTRSESPNQQLQTALIIEQAKVFSPNAARHPRLIRDICYVQSSDASRARASRVRVRPTVTTSAREKRDDIPGDFADSALPTVCWLLVQNPRTCAHPASSLAAQVLSPSSFDQRPTRAGPRSLPVGNGDGSNDFMGLPDPPMSTNVTAIR